MSLTKTHPLAQHESTSAANLPAGTYSWSIDGHPGIGGTISVAS